MSDPIGCRHAWPRHPLAFTGAQIPRSNEGKPRDSMGALHGAVGRGERFYRPSGSAFMLDEMVCRARAWRWVVVAGVLAGTPASAQAGKLSSIRSTVGSSGSSSASGSSGTSWSLSSSSSTTTTSSTETYGGYDDGTGALPTDPVETTGYARHPYARGSKGYVEQGSGEHGGRDLAGNLSIEGAYLGEQLWRAGFRGRLSVWRFDIETDLSFLLDRPHRDAMYLGSTTVSIVPVMLPRLLWRVGPGVNYMIDGRAPGQGPRTYAGGVAIATGAEVFPIRPLVFSARADVGTLYKTLVVGVRGTAGISLGGFELYAGYDARFIGPVALHGPTLGIRLWM